MRVILCPHCSEPYSLYLFEFGIPFWCRCGYILGAPDELKTDPVDDSLDSANEPFEEGAFLEEPDDDFSLFEDLPTQSGYGHAEETREQTSIPEDGTGDFRSQFEARIRDLGTSPTTEKDIFEQSQTSDETLEHRRRCELRAEELRRRAERICYLISSTDYSLEEIEIEKRTLRFRCQRYFPEMRDAYEHVYEARFEKLWRDFRED